ncbi:MAG: cell division protein MraZ [Ilumatobacteraceae bacterium]|nr:cell division protein MraZ [Ilumatobacteraceae bacterium]
MANRGEVEIDGGTAGTGTAARLPAFGHHPFSGSARTRVEANGRLALPATFKGAFTEHAIVRSGGTQCLFLMTPRAFELVVDALKANDPDMMLDNRKRQLLFMGSPRISVDRQSRVVLPPELRAKVGIEADSEIVIAGAIERLEIWPAARYDAQQAPLVDDVDRMFETFGGLSTDPA